MMLEITYKIIIYLLVISLSFGILELLYLRIFKKPKTKLVTAIMLVISIAIISVLFSIALY